MSKYRPVLTMTLFNRSDFTAEVLTALSKCRGIEKYHLFASMDGTDEEVMSLIENFDACPVSLQINPTKLGCPTNTHQALTKGFEHSDYVIHLEDDTRPSSDMLTYMEWAMQFGKEPNCISVTPYNFTRKANTNPQAVFRMRWFTPWIWSTWKNRWLEMDKKWNYKGWGVNVNTKIRGDRYTIKPALSRVQNIGWRGTHVPSRAWHAVNHLSPFVAENYVGDYVIEEKIRQYDGPC